MRKLVLMLSFLMVGFSLSFAQQSQQEVVYLKNGSIIKGTVIEQVPGVSLKIQTGDGSVFAYQMSEVEKITKEVASRGYSSNRGYGSSYDGNGVQRGYRGFLDLGYTLGTGDWGEDRIELSTSHGYQFNPYFYAGLGVGAHYYFDSEVVEVPIFADFRADFLNNRITPFFDFKIGYTVYDATGFYMAPSVGCRFATGNSGAVNVSLGYTMQKVEFEGYYYGSSSENCGGFSIKVGFEF
ncbi:MAG: hypothetical protein IJ494_06760 [Bacteroides sp.]|nr:hypothetical protein [Bacteroides sp.]